MLLIASEYYLQCQAHKDMFKLKYPLQIMFFWKLRLYLRKNHLKFTQNLKASPLLLQRITSSWLTISISLVKGLHNCRKYIRDQSKCLQTCLILNCLIHLSIWTTCLLSWVEAIINRSNRWSASFHTSFALINLKVKASFSI